MKDNYILCGTKQLDLSDYYIQTVAHSIWLAEDEKVVSQDMCVNSQHIIDINSIPCLSIISFGLQSAAPGDNIVVNVAALDEFQHNTTAFLKLDAIKVSLYADWCSKCQLIDKVFWMQLQDMTVNEVIFTPTIVQTVAGVGQIEFRYLSSNLAANTTVRLTPTFITEQVGM